MKWTVPADLRTPANAEAIAFLEATARSAHSDVAAELESAIRGLPGTSTVCPSPADYACTPAPEIGRDWVRFDPFAVDEPTPTTRARLHRWCMVAFQLAGGAGVVQSR